MFPREVPWVSRRWAARRFPDIRIWVEPERGGHFGALENPDAVVEAVLRGDRRGALADAIARHHRALPHAT